MAIQYPKVVTQITVPRDNCVYIDADYSQIEYRVLVGMAKEDYLMQMFFDPDTDYHTLQAANMYGVDYAAVDKKMRGDAKSFNFGIPYGMGFKSLAILLYGQTEEFHIEEAKRKYELYFKDQPKVRKFFEDVKEMALVNKYTKTYFGRRRYYSFTDKDGKESNAAKAQALRQAGNAVIQGCLHGDTRIQTKELGIVKIKDAVDTHLNVWDGEEWTKGDILYSGKKKKCTVTFSNGQSIICSPIHKFCVLDYNKNISEISNGRKFVECNDLKPGIKVECNKESELRILGDSGDTFVTVESVELTEEIIDMYDVCNTERGYYVADGIITHNTAADIMKISVARTYLYIKQNDLFGKLLLSNIVHDEQLMEVDTTVLNPKAVIRDIGKLMQFKQDGFPPLFIGAGFGMNWNYAKGPVAEIHPDLYQEICKSVEGVSIFDTVPMEPEACVKMMDDVNYEFRVRKVRTYLENPENHGKHIHPVIGSLIGGHFSFGLKQAEDVSDKEFQTMLLAQFIAKFDIKATLDDFEIQVHEQEVEEDTEYDDGEDDMDEVPNVIMDTDFALIDEKDKLFGIPIEQIIEQFSLVVSHEKQLVGIDARNLTVGERDKIASYLEKKEVDESMKDDSDVFQVCLLGTNSKLTYIPLYVKDVCGSELSTIINLNNAKAKASK